MLGTEEHFRRTIGRSRAQRLMEALTSSVERARKVATTNGFVEARTEPAIAFDFAVDSLSAFEAAEEVRRATVNGQHFWIVDESYAIRIKKLRSGFRSSNHRSVQQEKISHQIPLDGLEPLVYLTAGAVYSDRTGLPEQYVVVKYRAGAMARQAVEWVADLDELAAGGMAPRTPVLPLPSAPAAPAAVIPRRAGERKPGAASQDR